MLPARVQPKSICIVFWTSKNVTLGATLFSAIGIHLPSSLPHSYTGSRHPRGPKTAQGKWNAVIYLTTDKSEKQRRGKIQSSVEL